MKTKKIAFALLATASMLTSPLISQENGNQNESKTTISIETDPSTFLFGGYAFHFRIKPKKSNHLTIGAGTYGLNLPAVMVDMNADNHAKGWNVRINSAYSLFGEYYFTEANKKWFVGMQLGVQNYKNNNDQFASIESKYRNLLIMPSIGYNFRPFKIPLYIKPWMGIGYTSKLSGDNQINNLTYTISPLVPFVTLHVGYTFND